MDLIIEGVVTNEQYLSMTKNSQVRYELKTACRYGIFDG
jgi:hypothetical protein